MLLHIWSCNAFTFWFSVALCFLWPEDHWTNPSFFWGGGLSSFLPSLTIHSNGNFDPAFACHCACNVYLNSLFFFVRLSKKENVFMINIKFALKANKTKIQRNVNTASNKTVLFTFCKITLHFVFFSSSSRSISLSSSVTPLRELNFLQRKSLNLVIHASTFMQRWCRSTETVCSMTSEMDCAET